MYSYIHIMHLIGPEIYNGKREFTCLLSFVFA